MDWTWGAIFGGLGAFLGWAIKAEVEQSGHKDQARYGLQISLYTKIFEPLPHDFGDRVALIETITSASYRSAAFTLAMVSSDRVLEAWNSYAELFHTQERSDTSSSGEIQPLHSDELVFKFAHFLLVARQDVLGTQLQPKDMVRGLVFEVEEIFPNEGQGSAGELKPPELRQEYSGNSKARS